MLEQVKYPEHEKLSGIKELSQQLGSFLDWAFNQKGWTLCKYHRDDSIEIGQYIPVHDSVNNMLSKFYEIDLVKLEEEKLQMLEVCRNFNK